jgi:RES domain-containing protein
VAYGLTVARGGTHHRLTEPSWADPLDTSFARAHGGRWNAPGAFGVLYLNATVALARLQVAHKLAGLPYGVEDLDPSEQHDLVDVDVAAVDALDCVSDTGLRAVALPASYPADDKGRPVSWATCQAVGQRAHEAGLGALACRSAVAAASADDEELGVFDTHLARVTMTARAAFADWYWTPAPTEAPGAERDALEFAGDEGKERKL